MVPGKGISMQSKKQNKIKMQIIFATLIFMVVLVADFYAIINFSTEYILIAAITVILLVSLWGVLNGIFSLRELKEERREEQYDSIFKSEKASYLMLRKYFEELDEKIDILQKSSKVPTEEIVNAQKGIAKVVINRNRENADAIMGSNEQLIESIEEFENKIKESNDFIIESQKNTLYENLKEISEKQQILSDSIKDMEIRLSQAITANPIQFTANVEMPKGAGFIQPDAGSNTADLHEVMDDFAIRMPEPQPVEEPTQVEEQAVAEPTPTPEVDTSDPNRQLNPDEIAALFAGAQEAPEPVAEPVEEQPAAEPTPTPEVDTSDPNRQLSPDEIAALFAGAQATPEPEPATEEPKTPQIDMSDPNRNLTPDEIAALIGNL